MENSIQYNTLGNITGNILVVDDEPLVRKTICKFLEKSGYNITPAENGKDALVKLRINKFDLVITDLKMPEMDGRELLKEIAANYNNIPRIVLTAVGSDEDILLALKTGAYDFLTKPIVDYALLNHAVQRALERKMLDDQRRKSIYQMEQMNEVISMLNKGMEIDEVFSMLDVSLKKIIPFNRLLLISIDFNSQNLSIRYSKSDRKEHLKMGEIIPISNEFFKRISKKQNLDIVKSISDFIDTYNFPEKFSLLVDEGFQSAVIMPLVVNDSNWGYLAFCSEKEAAYTEEHITFLKLVAGQIALSIQRGELLTELEVHTKHLEHLVKVRTHEVLKIQKTTIFALSKLAETRDNETGEHLERMRNYCLLLAQLLKYSGEYDEVTNEFLKNIYDSSILHDIGKVGIPDKVLLKPGKLTNEEFDIIKTHTTIGYNALSDASKELGENSFLDMAKDIAYFHHERWDGHGYPIGLKEDEIPIAARIVTIGDIYDALTSKRPYKEPFSHEKAVSIMQEESYRFDPAILDLFTENNRDFDRIRKQFI